MREIKPTLKVYKPIAGTNITYVMGHVLRSPVKKRDKIPTPELIERQQGAILE